MDSKSKDLSLKGGKILDDWVVLLRRICVLDQNEKRVVADSISETLFGMTTLQRGGKSNSSKKNTPKKRPKEKTLVTKKAENLPEFLTFQKAADKYTAKLKELGIGKIEDLTEDTGKCQEGVALIALGNERAEAYRLWQEARVIHGCASPNWLENSKKGEAARKKKAEKLSKTCDLLTKKANLKGI